MLNKAKWLKDKCKDTEQYYGEWKIKEAYKMIRDINRKWQPRLTAVRDDGGKILMEKKDIIQRWTTYCSNLYKEPMDPIVTEQVIAELHEISPPLQEVENDILEVEVKRAIKRLKNNKSPGSDCITGEMIKHG